ncbi:conserved hypothetical protein [Ricinus communis]|uniref:Uncharacterized protein n=1 Tax=Ricinus communis TaxID=3988 RepID=B9TJV6_RICCO|nr:conserved hypothetical protein [Ricinus communis]
MGGLDHNTGLCGQGPQSRALVLVPRLLEPDERAPVGRRVLALADAEDDQEEQSVIDAVDQPDALAQQLDLVEADQLGVED